MEITQPSLKKGYKCTGSNDFFSVFFYTNIRKPNSYQYLGHCENKTGQHPPPSRHFYDMKTTWKDFQSCSELSRSRRKKFPLLKQERNPTPMTSFKVGYVIVSISYKEHF